MEKLYNKETLQKVVLEEKNKRQPFNSKEIPQYSIFTFEYTPENRMVKIDFMCKKSYRTIIKYITRNYVKYPIYSEWKEKITHYKKSLKLTNEVIENLNTTDIQISDDMPLNRFAAEIIYNLNDESLLPSWLIRSCIAFDYSEYLQTLLIQEKELDHNLELLEKRTETDLNRIDQIIKKETIKQKKLNKKIQALNNKLLKIEQRKRSIPLSILTLFIYVYLRSNKRRLKIQTRKTKFSFLLEVVNNIIKEKEKEVLTLNETLEKEKDRVKSIKNENNQKREIRQTEYLKTIRKVQQLPLEYKEKDDFVPLKSFSGLEYQKIVGCYVIRNNENKKYYVGQSKDVIKRLKQHFKGTVPKNIVFAEDYFSSNQKDNLFSVKILHLTTKDQLDKKERELIEFYDSRNNGYNGTAGNSD